MHKSVLVASIAAMFAMPGIAGAQQAAPAAEAKSPHTITGNMTLITDYRFRGISQTFGKPAIQGGFDYSHASGFYAGNWNSNVSETAGYPNGNIEMDFYGGWKNTFGDYGLDLGALYYYYPGSMKGGSGTVGAVTNPNTGRTATGSGNVNNTELYVGGSWKWLTLKYNYAISDYFSMPGTKNSGYLDLSATYDLGGGWGINGHVGKLSVKNAALASYTDYKIGATKDISGWVFGASLVATNAKDGGSCAAGTAQPYHFCKTGAATQDYKGGKSTILLSVGKTF